MITPVTLPAAVAATLATRRHQLLVDGQWMDAASGATMDVINPSSGAVLCQVAAGDAVDIGRAVAAARRAFDGGAWPAMTAAERSKMIWRLADALEAIADEMAVIETLDTGKPLAASRAFDVGGSIDRLRYHAGWATKISGHTLSVSTPRAHHAYTVREPIGVIGMIVPWNAPLMLAVTKIAPALAAGCTIVLKPAEQTPLSALRLGQLALDLGFPPGVINIVTGTGQSAGAALCDHPAVDKISFTGSTAVGRSILAAASRDFKRVTLELGGKSPVLVLPDADMKSTIEGVARGIFFNTGQVCSAGSRLFAHERVFDELVEGVAAQARRLKLGSGIEAGVDLGPLVSAPHLERVASYIAAGQREGATVRVGGNKVDGPGYFIEPTILTGTASEMTVRREEIFGPVLCAMSYTDSDLDRLAAEANDTSYGLAAHIWTRDLSAAHRLARKVKAGSIRINGAGLDPNIPTGGYRQSGWGRENGQEGLDEYTELKSVAIAL